MTRGANILLALGLFVPPTAWLLTQQGQGAVVYFHCVAGGPPIGPLIGLAGTGVCLLGGWLGWRGRTAETANARVLAQVALGAAVLFALANLATTAAAWIIPSCAR